MRALIEGKRDAEIALVLGTSSRTVQKQVESACCKLGALTRSQGAVLFDRRQRTSGGNQQPGR